MAQKSAADSSSSRGFNDVLGAVLLASALLLLVAQLSFDRHDIAFNNVPVVRPIHNLIGVIGAYLAYGLFFLFGVGAYLIPVLLVLFASSCVPGFFQWLGLGRPAEAMEHFQQRWRWHLIWAFVFLISFGGLLHHADIAGLMKNGRESIGSTSIGGWLGYATYEYGFWMLGKIGSIIVYGTLSLISSTTGSECCSAKSRWRKSSRMKPFSNAAHAIWNGRKRNSNNKSPASRRNLSPQPPQV